LQSTLKDKEEQVGEQQARINELSHMISEMQNSANIEKVHARKV
jgi:hypothetical protein